MRPRNAPSPTPAGKHDAPIALHRPMDSLQCADIPGNAVVRIVAAEHLIDMVRLISEGQVPHPHLVQQAEKQL